MADRHTQAIGTRCGGPGFRGAHTRGFSLTDLLISISVMVILIAILLPMLGGAYESARRVRCQSNLSQIGLAIQMYSDEHRGWLPPTSWGGVRTSANNPTTVARPQDSIFVRVDSGSTQRSASIIPNQWDGLGLLVSEDYLSTPEVLYCSSHHGDHNQQNYRDAWNHTDEKVATNYQYRVPPFPIAHFELDPATTLVSDAMRSKSDYNHSVGNNMLKADLTVAWFGDTGGKLLGSLKDDGSSYEAGNAVMDAWDKMDNDPRHSVIKSLPRPGKGAVPPTGGFSANVIPLGSHRF